MKNSNLSKTTFDIIFEHRNKAYGAYALRKEQDKNLARAFGFFLALISLLLFLTGFKSDAKEEKSIDTTVTIREIILPDIASKKPKPLKVDAPKPKLAPKVKTIKFVPPVVLQDERVEDSPPPVAASDLKESTVEIAGATTEGEDGERGIDLPPSDLDFGLVDTPKKDPVVPVDKVYTFVEKSASFPGGVAEMMAFLRKNIIYPAVARENNIQGRVVLTFVIEKDGSITDLKVERKVAGGCTEEAIRVIKKMPKWSPANQNGTIVRQRMTIPVLFKLR